MYYYTTNLQIQARDLMPHGKDIAVDLGFGAANSNKPVVLVVGDAYVPEIYDGPGTRVVVLHVDGASLTAPCFHPAPWFSSWQIWKSTYWVPADTSGPSFLSSKLGCTGSLSEGLAVVLLRILRPKFKNPRITKLLSLLFFLPQGALS